MTPELICMSGPLGDILANARERNLYVRKITLCRRMHLSLLGATVATESEPTGGIIIDCDDHLPDGHAVIECCPVPDNLELARLLDEIDTALGVKRDVN